MHPSTVRAQLLGLRRLSLPMQQPRRRAAAVASSHVAAGSRGAFDRRDPGEVLDGDIDGTPARVFDLTDRGARIELSYPVVLSEGTLRVEIEGATYELSAHVRWYRRHPDGPAAYGVEFSAPLAASGVA